MVPLEVVRTKEQNKSVSEMSVGKTWNKTPTHRKRWKRPPPPPLATQLGRNTYLKKGLAQRAQMWEVFALIICEGEEREGEGKMGKGRGRGREDGNGRMGKEDGEGKGKMGFLHFFPFSVAPCLNRDGRWEKETDQKGFFP